MKHYHIIDNATGCLPESDPVVVESWERAKQIVKGMLDQYDEDDYGWERAGRYLWNVYGESAGVERVIEIQPCEEEREDCKIDVEA